MFGLVRKYLSACQLNCFCRQGPNIGISQLPVYSLVAPRPAAAHILLDLGDDPAGPGVVVPLVDQPLEHLHTAHIIIIIIIIIIILQSTHIIELLDEQLALFHPVQADDDHPRHRHPEHQEPDTIGRVQGVAVSLIELLTVVAKSHSAWRRPKLTPVFFV